MSLSQLKSEIGIRKLLDRFNSRRRGFSAEKRKTKNTYADENATVKEDGRRLMMWTPLVGWFSNRMNDSCVFFSLGSAEEGSERCWVEFFCVASDEDTCLLSCLLWWLRVVLNRACKSRGKEGLVSVMSSFRFTISVSRLASSNDSSDVERAQSVVAAGS